MFNLDY